MNQTIDKDNDAKKIDEKNKNNKKNNKKKNKSDFEFCKVCNLNHDQGLRHKYFPSHNKALSAFFSRFQSKLSDVRFFLKNPTVLRPEHASRNRLWCVFCDADVDELGSSFACGNTIHHLASLDHLKKLKHFLWKYGGGMDQMDIFRILDADVAKWEKKCKALRNETASAIDGSRFLQVGPSNDIQNELNHKNINNFEKNDFDPLNVSNGVMPLQYITNEYQISHSGHSAIANVGQIICDAVSSLPIVCSSTRLGSSNERTSNWMSNESQHYNSAVCMYNHSNGRPHQVSQEESMVKGVSSSHGLLSMTQISAMASKKVGENVHTGAPPPWFEETEENLLNVQPKSISSSFVLPLNKSGKKLNPKRVGAAWAENRKIELEMEKRGEIVKTDCNVDWLPNFGRVWQSGSRKESRKEFEKQKQTLPKVGRNSEIPIMIQPYISKRMRRDATEQQ